MNARIQALFRSAEGRYFTPEERQTLRDFAESVPNRLEVMERIERCEPEILRAVVEELKRRHPDFGKLRDQPWARLYRDLQLVLRSCAAALAADDLRQLDESALYWLRSIADACAMEPTFQAECYGLLRDQCRSQLPTDSYRLLQPFLDRAVAVLGQEAESILMRA